MAAAVLASGLVGVDAGARRSPAAAATRPPAAAASAPTPEVTARPDLVSAALAARVTDHRVEVTGAETPFSTTWANPDGTLTTEAHSGQIRYRDRHGQWRPVDLTLAAATDGGVAPRGQAFGLTLAGPHSAPGADGSTALASVGAGPGRQVSLGWPGRLPAPALSGTAATYRDAAPGVDVVVQALRNGFEQDFVIKSQPAGPVSWQLPLHTQGLTARAEPDGSVAFVDAHGVPRSRFAPPLAWDAAVDPRSGDPVSTAPVQLAVTQRGAGLATLTITPDPAWLADPARVFPVTVDPTYAALTVYPSYDAFVQTGYTSDQSAGTELRLGTYDGGTDKARSFLSFPMSSWKGYQVMSANLSLYETWSYSCTAATWQVWDTGAASTATTWTNQPSWNRTWASPTTTKGYSSSCPAGRDTVAITSLAQAWAGNGNATNTLGIRALSETDSYGWKKFASAETSNDPYLSITYDRKPNAAATPTLTPVATYNTTTYTSDTTPTFSSKATDPDGNTVYLKFEVHPADGSSTVLASCSTAYVASGATASCSPPTALADNAGYEVRAAVYDGYLWNGSWSPWTAFTLAAAAPAVPTVSCPSPYSDGSWADTAPTSNLTCTISAAGSTTSKPVRVLASVDGGTEKSYTIASPGTSGQVTVTVPNTAGGHSVKARSQSAANVDSAYAPTYTFGYGQAALSSPKDGTASSSTFQVTGNAPPRGSATGVTGVPRIFRTADPLGSSSEGMGASVREV